MKGSSRRRVTVHYTGRLEDGTVFDSSRDGEPLVVPLGQERVIPGFEEALVGMSPGERKTVTISPRKAYGPYREELVSVVEKGKFPPDLDLRVDQHLQLRNSSGLVTQARVSALTEEAVTLDANHPLAGKKLIFELEVLEVS